MLYLEDYLESEWAALAGAVCGTCGRARARVDGQAGWQEGGGGGGCFFLTVTGSLAVGCRLLRPPPTHARTQRRKRVLSPLAPPLWRTLPLTVIEQLPMDLRDRFTEMREMDLQVQSKSARLPVLAARVQCQTYLQWTSSPLLCDSPPAHWLVHKEL